MFAKNLFLKLKQLHHQAGQGLVGWWLCLYVLGKEGWEEKQSSDKLSATSHVCEFLEAPGTHKIAPFPSACLVHVKRASGGIGFYCHQPGSPGLGTGSKGKLYILP